MSKNRGVVYTKPGEVQVQDIADPKFESIAARYAAAGSITYPWVDSAALGCVQR